MNTHTLCRPVLILLLAAGLSPCARAQLNIPGADGADGPLIISNNFGINLAKATNGSWTDPVPGANIGKGIYDSNKWAVVFRYSSVVISNGATLTFTNHPKHPPVVWLVSGDVTINGTISLDGQNGAFDAFLLTEPGPGGFRGGSGYYIALGQGPNSIGSGLGPGGGYNNNAGEGVYGQAPTNAYGSVQILPLVGGSGGRGTSGGNGGGGGGAILIAASNNITINGSIHANGGTGQNGAPKGSAGAIRLVANRLLGTITGSIEAAQPDPPTTFGRIRLEAYDNTVSGIYTTFPQTIVQPTASPATIWPLTNSPVATILSVASIGLPVDPTAALNLGGGDLIIGNTNAVNVDVQTVNFPTNGSGKVDVYFRPRNFAPYTIPATFLNGNTNQATWRVTTALSNLYTVMQARAYTTN